MVQVSQNVVRNRSYTTEARMARWLATTQDRVGRDEFPLTQEFLSQMLGVHRPTVSDTAQRIQAQKPDSRQPRHHHNHQPQRAGTKGMRVPRF